MAGISITTVGILNSLLSLYAMMVQQLTQLMKRFWATPSVDPITNVASLGTNAAAIFTVSAAASAFLQSVAETLSLPTPNIPGVPPCYVLTPNNDFSMTCASVVATAPASLAITGGVLTWAAVVGAIAYTIQKSADGGQTWQAIATLKGKDIWTPPATTFTDSALVSGNQYQIASSTPGGASAFSSAITAA